MTDDSAVAGEMGGYVPCGGASATVGLTDDTSAMFGTDNGYVPVAMTAGSDPASFDDAAALFGSAVGFVAKPCCGITDTWTRTDASVPPAPTTLGTADAGIDWDLTYNASGTSASATKSVDGEAWRIDADVNVGGTAVQDLYLYGTLHATKPLDYTTTKVLRFELLSIPPPGDTISMQVMRIHFDPVGLGFGLSTITGTGAGAPFINVTAHEVQADPILSRRQEWASAIGISENIWSVAVYGAGQRTTIPAVYWRPGVVYTVRLFSAFGTPIPTQTRTTVSVSDGSTTYTSLPLDVNNSVTGNFGYGRGYTTDPKLGVGFASGGFGSATPWAVRFLDLDIPEINCCTMGFC